MDQNIDIKSNSDEFELEIGTIAQSNIGFIAKIEAELAKEILPSIFAPKKNIHHSIWDEISITDPNSQVNILTITILVMRKVHQQFRSRSQICQ